MSPIRSIPIDEVMSHITGSSIQWGSDPRIMSSALTETVYLFLRVVCHSLWPISHLHTIPLERCVFLYAFMSGASNSFPHLFLHSLNEVHRSSAIGHALIYPIFIQRILYLVTFRASAFGKQSLPLLHRRLACKFSSSRFTVGKARELGQKYTCSN